MLGKNFLTILLAAAALLTGSLTISAQVAGAGGKVMLAAADGSTKPAAGVLIETYRIDITQKGPTATTRSNGEFRFAGLPLGGKFIISVSGTGISPTVFPNFAAGVDSAVITVYAGDGRKFTEAEARDALKNPPTAVVTTTTAGSDTKAAAQTSAEQKKQQEEFNKKVEETKASNEKVKNADAIAASAFKEGREALMANNYDLAIAKADTGLAAVPDFIGSSPALLNVKAGALRSRAVDTYNKNSKSTDVTVKLQAMESVKKDLGDSATAYSQAYNLVKKAPAADLSASPNAVSFSKDSLVGAKESFRLMAATKQVDADKLDIAKTLLPEYMKMEADAAEKTKAQNILGDLYLNAGDYENAVVEYRKVLEVSPDNLDALGSIGFSLVSQGYIIDDEGKQKKDKALIERGKSKMQEGSNYLQKFYAAAPDTNQFKKDAKDTIDSLKADQNVTPQKITVTKKKG